MNLTKNFKNIFLIVFLLAIISCAKFVDIKEGSDKILLVTKEPEGCISKGTVDVSVLSEIAYVERSKEAIDRDLLQLAKNSAVSVKANTIMKSESPEPGKATFSMYKCKRPWAE
tara:strand:+ start:10341 stop:10682 length:342 start_codon:yes stop_codon:yes gene_type:complete